MEFGWVAQAFWVLIAVAVLAAIWYGKRNPPPPK